MADLAGLTVGAITRIETNIRIPKIDTLMKIAKVLGTTVDGLVETTLDPLQKHKELADRIYGKQEPTPQTVGSLSSEDLKQLIKETMTELGQNSQTPEKSVSSKSNVGELSDIEIKIIKYLRADPSFISTVVELLTPDEDLAPVAPPVPMNSKTVTTTKGSTRKAK